MSHAPVPHQPGEGDAAAPSAMPVRRRARRRGRLYHRPRRYLWVAGACAVLAAAMGGGYYYWTTAMGAPVFIAVNEKPLVAVANEAVAERVVNMAKQNYFRQAPEMVVFKEGDITIEKSHGLVKVDKLQDAVNILDSQLTAAMQGYAIFVNGAPLVIFRHEADAAEAMSLMLQRGAAKDKDGIPTFKERVVIAPMEVVEGKDTPLPLVTPGDAAKQLVRPPLPNYHTVQRGDSFWVIANANGLTIMDLEKLNPGVDTHSLHIGDKVRLPDSPSPVTIIMRNAKGK